MEAEADAIEAREAKGGNSGVEKMKLCHKHYWAKVKARNTFLPPLSNCLPASFETPLPLPLPPFASASASL